MIKIHAYIILNIKKMLSLLLNLASLIKKIEKSFIKIKEKKFNHNLKKLIIKKIYIYNKNYIKSFSK